MKKLLLILGSHLFHPQYFPRHEGRGDLTHENPLGLSKAPLPVVFMREDPGLATRHRFHKQKLFFCFATMRAYAQELQGYGYSVHYESYGSHPDQAYLEALSDFLNEHPSIEEVIHFEVEDPFFHQQLSAFFQNRPQLKETTWSSPLFLSSPSQVLQAIQKTKKPFMKTFYEGQRRQFKILIDSKQAPVGGSWSFDVENRKPLPKGLTPPPLPSPHLLSRDARDDQRAHQALAQRIESTFSQHPGSLVETLDSGSFWLPTTRSGAQAWLKDFLKHRLGSFGPYEDALPAHSATVYHSVLTPFLNCGLLTPQEVLTETLQFASKHPHEVPLPSLEGFVRQILGWREFIRGMSVLYEQKPMGRNFWNHTHLLSPVWYQAGGSGIPVLDRALDRVQRSGYLHHIERLMVIGSLMVLLEIHPSEAYSWFMELFIDSADWVMAPNVYGMALFADGGLFTTKPYLCGSNYLRKMSGDPVGPWCDGVDGLYWEFIEKHQAFFSKNPRLSMMARSVEKISPEKWKKLRPAAAQLRKRLRKPAGS